MAITKGRETTTKTTTAAALDCVVCSGTSRSRPQVAAERAKRAQTGVAGRAVAVPSREGREVLAIACETAHNGGKAAVCPAIACWPSAKV